eukprot:117358_1
MMNFSIIHKKHKSNLVGIQEMASNTSNDNIMHNLTNHNGYELVSFEENKCSFMNKIDLTMICDEQSDSNNTSTTVQPRSFSHAMCNKGHTLTKAIISDIIDVDEIFTCTLLCGGNNFDRSEYVYQCNTCEDYGICSHCFVQKRGKKRSRATQDTSTQPKKKRKYNNIVPWHIGLVMQSRKTGEKISIRDYDNDTKLTFIWGLTNEKYLWIDLDDNNNLFPTTDTKNVLNARTFVPDNNWRAPTLELYQIINVKTDMKMYENDRQWYPGFIVGFDPDLRRHCIDYGMDNGTEITEWMWLDKNSYGYWGTKHDLENNMEMYRNSVNLNNKIEMYRNSDIKIKTAPKEVDVSLYGLTNEFIKASRNIYVKRVRFDEVMNENSNNKQLNSGMCEKVKIRRNQKIIEENGNSMIDLRSDCDSDIEMKSDMKYDPFNHPFYDYVESKLIDNAYESEESIEYIPKVIKKKSKKKHRKLKKKRKKRKKRKKNVKKSYYDEFKGRRNVSYSESDSNSESDSDSESNSDFEIIIDEQLFPYSVKPSDHKETPITVKSVIVWALETYYPEYYTRGDVIYDGSPFKCCIDCNDYRLYPNSVIFDNPNYSAPWPQVIQLRLHSKHNNQIGVGLIPFGGNKKYWEEHIWPYIDRSITLRNFAFVGYKGQPMFNTVIVFFKPNRPINVYGEHNMGTVNVKKWVNDRKEEGEYNKFKRIATENIIRFDDYLREKKPNVYKKLSKKAEEYIENNYY